MAEYIRPSPSWTLVSHAVRWIADKSPFASPSEAYATDDFPDISDARFGPAKSDFSAAVRNGIIQVYGVTAVAEVGANSAEISVTGILQPLDSFAHSEKKLQPRKGSIAIANSRPMVPSAAWISKYIDWNENTLSYDNRIKLVVKGLKIKSDELVSHFGTSDDKLKRAHEINRTSMMRLIAGMAAGKYHFDPEQRRSRAVSAIRSDMELLGVGMDDKTIRSYLHQSIAYAKKVASANEE